MTKQNSKIVTVCDKCLRACCWQGQFMCEESTHAGTITKTVGELKKLKLEHSDYWEKEEEIGLEEIIDDHTTSNTIGSEIMNTVVTTLDEMVKVSDALKKADLIEALKASDQNHIVKKVKEWGVPSRIFMSHLLPEVIRLKKYFSRFAETKIIHMEDTPTILFFWDKEIESTIS